MDTVSSESADSFIDEDPVFQKGLESILGPMKARGASEEELEQVKEKARRFYMSSKPPTTSSNSATTSSTASSETLALAPATSVDPPPPTNTSTSDQPPYPLSFAALANLIATGAPIPGIKDIPDKLAEGEPSVSQVDVRKVRKPWEKDASDSEQTKTDLQESVEE